MPPSFASMSYFAPELFFDLKIPWTFTFVAQYVQPGCDFFFDGMGMSDYVSKRQEYLATEKKFMGKV